MSIEPGTARIFGPHCPHAPSSTKPWASSWAKTGAPPMRRSRSCGPPPRTATSSCAPSPTTSSPSAASHPHPTVVSRSSVRPRSRAADGSISRPLESLWNCETVPFGGPRTNWMLQMVPIGGPAPCNGCLGGPAPRPSHRRFSNCARFPPSGDKPPDRSCEAAVDRIPARAIGNDDGSIAGVSSPLRGADSRNTGG